MKRFFLLVSFILFFTAPVFATCDYLNRCPAYYPNVSSNLAQFFSNATGTTYLAEQFAQNMIKQELAKATNQIFEVNVKAFSLEDLFEGKFKSLTVTGSNIELGGIYLSSLKIQTLCNFNSVDIKSRPIKLRENAVLGVWVEFSAQDLRNSIEYGNHSQEVSKIDLSGLAISSFRVYSPTINIENGKLYFTINAKPMGPYKPMDISIGADIKVQDGNVISSKIDMINLYSGFNLTQFSNSLNPINYLKFPINLSGTQKAEVQIQDVNIVDNRAFLHAMIFIPKV